MRYVERDRVEPPRILMGPEAQASRQQLLFLFSSGLQKRSQTRLDRSRSIIDHPDLRRTLAELFGHTCAFCETPVNDPQPYRFRPAEGAYPVTDPDVAHLYYVWLADAWQNLYPVCSGCMPKDPFHFPVSGGLRAPLPTEELLREYAARGDGRWPQFPLDEAPVLVDPCFDRKLWRHFRFTFDGRIAPYRMDRRGRMSIAHFQLDRPDLVDARSFAFAEYFEEFKRGLGVGPVGYGRPYLADGRAHAGAWRLLLRNLLAEALDRKASEDLEGLTLQLSRQQDWPQRLDAAHDRLWSASEPEAVVGASRPPKGSKEPMREPSRIAIRNFKSLERVDLSLPPPPTGGEPRAAALLILGENAAGKSTILEAIAVAMMGGDVRRQLKLKAGRLVLNPRYLGAGSTPPPETAYIEVHYPEGECQRLKITPTAQASRERYVAADFSADGPSNPIPLFAYGAFRQYLGAQRRHSRFTQVRSLFQPDQLLSNPERWLLRLSDSDFNMVVRAIRNVFSVEGEFEVLERRGDAIYVIQKIGPDSMGPPQETPLDIVSSGFRAVLAMLCDIMRGLMDRRLNPAFTTLESARGIVLVDEIEAHLHPRWKMAIMTGLRRALPQVTFIVTSHDPLCLRGMGPGEVLVLERIPGGQADSQLPVFTQPLVDLPDNSHWTIEQLLTADFFQLRSTVNAEAELRLARMQDKLAKGITPADDPELQAYLAELSHTLPIGNSEVHRLVQEALAQFLAEQRTATNERLKALKQETRQAIVDALRRGA